jgi:hypothetical protein
MLNSQSQYWSEVNAVASNLVAECMQECDNNKEQAQELINDNRLHETIEGHEWVIYYTYNLSVLTYSDNTEYGIENGLVSLDSKTFSLATFHSNLAFWAMYADVQNALDGAFDDFEESQQSN